MIKLTVLNPAAGKGKATAQGSGYITISEGDCRRYVREKCDENPCTHFDVYGGDGTLNEAISGIMDAGAGDKAEVTVVPCGSGNDTVKTTGQYEKGTVLPLDLICFNEHYGVNMLNIGFDCDVAASAGEFKKKMKIAGGLSYILGVVCEFFKPIGQPFKITAICEDDSEFSFEGPVLLCAVCNGQWCGGGFHNSPLSDMTDGILELLLVKKTSRFRFLRLVGMYRKGTIFSKDQRDILPELKDLVFFKRIKRMTVSGCKQICADGEIINCTQAQISVLHGAVKYRV